MVYFYSCVLCFSYLQMSTSSTQGKMRDRDGYVLLSSPMGPLLLLAFEFVIYI